MTDFLADRVAPAAVILGGNAADLWTTERALAVGAGERNPHGQTFQGRLTLKALSVVALGGADLALQKVERRRVVVLGHQGPERRKPFLAHVATAGKWALRAGAAAHFARTAWGNRRVELEMKGLR